MAAMPIDSTWGPYFDLSTSGDNLQAFTQGTEALAAAVNRASARPSPTNNSHLSPAAGALSPSSTIDPSDSVSRTHSPPKSLVNLEEEIPRQSTDEENMFALGDILDRAAKHQKQLRMSRLAGKFGSSNAAPPSAPAAAPAPSAPAPPVVVQPANPSKSSQMQKASGATQPGYMDAHMMPPDPFAENDPNQFAPSSAPVRAGSPPANPFAPSSSVPAASFSAPESNADAAIPWTKEIAIVGLYQNSGSSTSTTDPLTIPVAIAATPDQNLEPELWPTPMVVHPGNLNGPVELISFHEMVVANAVPYCILLPYVDGMQDGYHQLAALSDYERLTQTLRERKSFVRITFPIPGRPQGTGVALYPRFDHHAGAFRLLAAVFTRGAVPVPTPPQQSPSPSSNTTSQRKIAPLPRPLKRPSANMVTAMNGAPADASSLLNVDRPFGDGTNGSAPPHAPPTGPPAVPVQAVGVPQPQMMYDDVAMSMHPSMQQPMQQMQQQMQPFMQQSMQQQMQPSMQQSMQQPMQQYMQAPMPDGVPNGYNGYGYPQGFDPSFNAMAAPQMQPEFAYYGMQPQSGYPQPEDTVMTSSQPYPPAGTVWNMS